jgi:hypothetical protein
VVPQGNDAVLEEGLGEEDLEGPEEVGGIAAGLYIPEAEEGVVEGDGDGRGDQSADPSGPCWVGGGRGGHRVAAIRGNSGAAPW